MRNQSRTAALPCVEAVVGLPAEHLAGIATGSSAERASSPCRAGACTAGASTPAARGHGVVELVHRGLDAGADVAEHARAPVGGPDERVDDVVDVDEVAGLLAVAEDGAGLAGEQPPGEDGDDAGLAVRVLTGAVDVGQGQRGELEPVQRR